MTSIHPFQFQPHPRLTFQSQNPHCKPGVSFWLILFLLSASFLISPVRPAIAVDTPNPLSPSNGATTTISNYPPLGIPEFSWSSVAGATNYRIQWSSDIGFVNVVQETVTPNTVFTPFAASAFADGTWYWHVRVESPAVGTYSPTFSFTKQWAAGNAPVLNAPSDNATIDFYDQPIFSWQPVMGAARYRFQIATSQLGFNAPILDVFTLAPTYQPVNKLANGTYYWRVVPQDPASRDGTSSVVRSFNAQYNQVPTLLQPLNNSNPTFTPTFNWTAVRGAQMYRLQYSTDPSFNSGVNQVETPNTTFTPNTALPNDVNYYWRVRVISGASTSDSWSATWTFVKQWYLQPTLLTPPNLQQYVSEPLFTWTPVPGARSYQVEVNQSISFNGAGLSDNTVNTYYQAPAFAWETQPLWYWRVRPIDANGNLGQVSNVFSFNTSAMVVSPRQIYPLYYYPPTSTLQPHLDRTVPLPIFEWHRMISGTAQTNAYRVQVSPSSIFANNNWTYDTENLSAVPTAANPFTPTVGGIYYWRVSQLDGVGGNLVGQWSQVWKTRIDTTQGLTPTAGTMPTLLRPFHSSESVETTPLLEWFPLQGADSYDVQVSDDPNFGTFVVPTTTVPYPAFSPQTRLSYGTYYWRVRGRSGGVPLGNFSPAWRFQVAAQSHWQATRNLGDSANRSLIGSDPAGDMTDPNYDLSTLYVTQSQNDWFFGFNVGGSADVTYGLYLDLDHADNSGATTDALGLNISTIAAHRPEYAIYTLRTGGVFSGATTYIYQWSGGGWGNPLVLSNISGGITTTANYVELMIPNTAIGMQDTTGSVAVSLFSAMATGHAQDTVPSDPNVAYTTPNTDGSTTVLSRFASVSERLTLTLPPSTTSGDPTTLASILPFMWQYPVNVPWAGYALEVHRDPQFTSLVWAYSVCCSPYIPADYTYNTSDFFGDNTYYWRVRPIYAAGGSPRGAWSQPMAFNRQGLAAQNLQYSVNFATPTFSWSMGEGAESYEIQVATDPGFGSPIIGTLTVINSYTPASTINPGTYYWRVRIHPPGVTNQWSAAQTFTLALPKPSGLSTSPAGVVGRAPTYCWTPLIEPTSGPAVLAAWRYRIQVSRNDPTFSSIYDQMDTEQECWTPTHGYDDGTYYWRAAMMDGQGRLGDFTSALTVTKQYPVTTLVSPLTGSTVMNTPTFVWTPVNGAASYKIEVSTSPIYSSVYDTAIVNNTRYTPARKYDPGTYYWRIAIIDADGKQGPFNTATLILNPNTNPVYLPLIIR